MIGYVGNIEEFAEANNNFRQVVYTGKHSQLVVMSLLPNEEIGLETHDHVDQFFRVEVGQLKVVIDGEEHTLTEGMAAIVPAGCSHNVINTGNGIAKLYTIYSPANHPDHTIHATKSEAEIAESEEHQNQ